MPMYGYLNVITIIHVYNNILYNNPEEHILPKLLYCTVLYCTVLYCTVLYCTVLYCTVYFDNILLYRVIEELNHITLISKCSLVELNQLT